LAWLLDINVLIARVDPAHEFHAPVCRWLKQYRNDPLVTCPLTENGFLRIYGHPNYPGGPGSPEAARRDLLVIRSLPNHQFLTDSVSLGESIRFPSLEGASPKQLTDLYLLALAAANGIRFATFDQQIPVDLMSDGRRALEVISVK